MLIFKLNLLYLEKVLAMNSKQLLIAFTSLMLFMACSSQEEGLQSGNQTAREYALVKVDSFSVENLTRVFITDYSEEEGIYLGFAGVQKDILEIAPNGDILKRVNRTGEGPNNYGRFTPISLSFGPEKTRVIEVLFDFIQYNDQYEIINKKPSPTFSRVMTQVPLVRIPFIQKADTNFFFIGPANILPVDLSVNSKEELDTLQQFTLFDPVSGVQRHVIPYDSTSIYKQTDKVYRELMGKNYFIDGEELVLVNGLDTSIAVHSLSDFSKTKEVPFTHADFKVYPPIAFDEDRENPAYLRLSTMAGRNEDLFNAGGGFWILRYFQGMTEPEYNRLKGEKELIYYTSPEAEHKFKLIVFHDGQQMPGELTPPPGSMVFGLGNGTVLVRDPSNPDVEEDFTHYSIYALREIN